jgi:hypothetical protein
VRLKLPVVRRARYEHADAPQTLTLLRARRERHGSRNNNNSCNEIASSHCLPPRDKTTPIMTAM